MNNFLFVIYYPLESFKAKNEMTDKRNELNRLLENDGIKILAPVTTEFAEILTPEALRFIAELTDEVEYQRYMMLEFQKSKQEYLNEMVVSINDFEIFNPHPTISKSIRSSKWQINPLPKDLQKRWVEITGPASSKKMVINALNSGADVYMADAEDSESPTWENIINGQINLRDAINKTISLATTEKTYKLNEKPAVLMFRPRGWHLLEKHLLINGRPVPASIFDFGLYFFHNAKNLLAKGTGPYFYLPKLESQFQAALWNRVFVVSQNKLGIPQGTVKATVLIETLQAAFQMEEILCELREHSAGLNCGRWDYIFSFIKKFQNQEQFVLPDRSELTMDKGFLAAYVNLLIQTCHKRGAHAIGGMAAQIPIKNDPAANEKALEKIRADKLREVQAGHDGTWVAHPGLVPIAQKVFSAWLDTRIVPAKNQLEVLRSDIQVTAADLLKIPEGEITEAGLRTNLRVGVQYLEAWLNGNGCVPINNLMEDAATAEISRSQVWQWLRHSATLNDGRPVTLELVKQILEEEAAGRDINAKNLFLQLTTAEEFPEFLTLPLYELLFKLEKHEQLIFTTSLDQVLFFCILIISTSKSKTQP